MNTRVNWLKSRREQLQISQEELAKKLQLAGFDISRAAISGWETARFNPPLDNNQFRSTLARILQMSIAALLAEAGYEVESSHTPAGDRGASIIDNLPPERQKLALDLLDVLARD
jgi:transcriptional regulator with XRE-family HTH domain